MLADRQSWAALLWNVAALPLPTATENVAAATAHLCW